MRMSCQWLARHVDLDGLTPEGIANDLTLHTAEVEGVERFAPVLDEVVVGHVVECDRHPDADKLSLCRVDIGAAGDGEALHIVCGAPNVAKGQKVAVARVGVVLPDGTKLKRAKIRGVESCGMISSERELGLGDEHDGIWELPLDAPVGETVARALQLDDWVIEIDNKSLTHRPDLWGHRGIASEIAAIHGRALRPLDLALPATAPGEPYPVRVESEGCFRYIGLPIDGVRNGRSPDWMRLLLLAVGQRPLDLLVDVSNFVMLDLGQPNHLFDRRRLADAGITVRDARPGETMRTLDGVERRFDPSDVLICSGAEPVAVAGVMGGDGAKVEEDTSELLLEVAAFHPTRVRRTAARLGLRTDASARFEKSLDPTLPAKAAAHLVSLLRAIQPELTLPRPMGDAGTWSDPARTVEVRPTRVRTVLGAPVGDDAIETTLTRLGFGVSKNGTAWKVAVPSARATKDVGIEEDLIEEVGRMYGYDNIEERRLTAELEPPARDERRLLVRRLQDRLAGAARFHEAMTHTFQADALLARLGIAEEPYVRALNPQMEDAARVRRSVLPSLVAVLPANRRHHADVRLFEIGKGYRPEHANERGEPREVHELALAWVAPRPAANARFDAALLSRLQGVVADIFRCAGLGAPVWSRAQGEHVPAWAHPAKCVTIGHPEATGPVGLVAELEPALQRELGLVGELDGEACVAVLSIDVLLGLEAHPTAYRPIARFPGIKVDVALAVPDELPAAEVLAVIERAGKGLVSDVELFDLYRGESIGAGRKSLAYHVLLQASDKTLTDKDEAKFLGRVERAIAEVGGELRRD